MTQHQHFESTIESTFTSMSQHFIHSCTLTQPSTTFGTVYDSRLSSSIDLYPILDNRFQTIPTFFALTDSHGKYFPKLITTPHYHLITQAVSGLQWINPYNTHLCTRSLLLSPSLNSILSTCVGILFLVGTNSIRNTTADLIIDQVEEIIDIVRSRYTHFNHPDKITIVSAFPCLKTSVRFVSQPLLTQNLDDYNTLLHHLAIRKQFSVMHIPITIDHLARDGMHINLKYLPFLKNFVEQYCTDLSINRSTMRRNNRRSCVALQRRNKKRHDHLRERRRQLVVVRSIAKLWTFSDIKSYLQYKKIKGYCLPQIYHQILRIQFTNKLNQQYAEHILSSDVFDEPHYFEWHFKRN